MTHSVLADSDDASPQPLIQEALKYEGKPITAIQFEPADQPLTTEELQKRLPFAGGELFRERALRKAIQNLYATGRFADIAVDAQPDRGGVALRFLTKRAYFIGRVVVLSVAAPPSGGQLASATKLRLGLRYEDAQKNQAIEALQSLLRANGYYYATVGADVEYDDRNETANVRFEVETGKRAHFERPAIGGDVRRSDATIIRATHWKRLYGLLGWHEVTEARVRQGIENVSKYYEKTNLVGSTVTLTKLDYHEQSNTAEPHIYLNAGRHAILKMRGFHISQGKLRQLVPIFQERSIDADLLLEGQQNIEQFLQSEGYFGAHVSYSIAKGETSQDVVITFDVDHGSRRKFAHLEIHGNHYFPAETIRERLYIEPAQFPRFPFGRFSEAYLKQDLESIKQLYQSNGFLEANITSKIIDNYRGSKSRIAAFISIEEGRQSFVSNLRIEGASPTDLLPLRAMLVCSPGQPFSQVGIATDRENFLNYYYNRGYLNATFDYYIDRPGRPEAVTVRYVIAPGERKFVRDVLISGLETTRSSLVQNRMELKKGEPLSLAAETDTQRRLYDLGIFARVNTALQNPDGDEEDKIVLYDIDEARHYSLNIGIGAQIARIGGGVTTLDNPAGTTGFAPRLAVGVSRLNFLGLGQTLGLQTSVSTIEQRAALTYFIPHFVSHDNLNFTITTLFDNSNDVRTYTAQRREISAQLGQRLSRAYTIQYRIVFRHVSISNLKIDYLLVPLLSQPETVGLGEISLIQDKRDDPTDAHRGIYTTVDLAYAPGFLGSQTDFGRMLIRNSTYHAFGRDFVFARSTQFGIIERTGGRPAIPLAERFYSGGSTSIRAFPDFQAGPRDLATGFPLGGDALLINNLELRFPLYGDNVGGVLFEDAGNVYSSLGDVSLRFRQENLQDFNYMVQGVGFGIRYRTPIGPIRVDLSLSPDAPRFYGLKGTEQQYLNGTAIAQVQKISAFQFHISLGQAF